MNLIIFNKKVKKLVNTALGPITLCHKPINTVCMLFIIESNKNYLVRKKKGFCF